MNSSSPEAGNQQEMLKILVADDDAPTRMMLRAAISQWNYNVIEAKDGEEAWEILQKPDAPRLLIIDWLMPKLDGLSLSERVKHKQGADHNSFIILLTQLSGTTNVTRALEAGADEFLSKPFNMAELRSRLSVGEKIVTIGQKLAQQDKTCQQYAAFTKDLAKKLSTLTDEIRQNANVDANYKMKMEESVANLNTFIKKINSSVP